MKNGFTLVELLVAVTIIAIMGTFGITTFESLSQSIISRATMDRIDTEIVSLNREVSQGRMTGYELLFSKDALGIITNTNIYKITMPMTLNTFDWQTFSGSLDFSGSTLPGYRLIRANKEYQTTIWATSTGIFFTLTGSFESAQLVEGFDNTIALNTLRILPFDRDSGILSHLKTKVTFSWSTSTGIVLSNTRWKISLRDISGTPLTAIDLILTRWDIQFIHTITPWK